MKQLFNLGSMSVMALIMLFTPLISTAEESTQIPLATDLRIEAELAKKKGVPILLLFGTDHCPYCERIKADYLKPMIISGEYDNKVIIREVHYSTRWDDVIDFDGEKVSVDKFGKRYKVKLYPTLVFVDANGKKLVGNIVGYNTPSLFGARVDKKVELSLLKVQSDAM